MRTIGAEMWLRPRTGRGSGGKFDDSGGKTRIWSFVCVRCVCVGRDFFEVVQGAWLMGNDLFL
jgi:hypothetical protein